MNEYRTCTERRVELAHDVPQAFTGWRPIETAPKDRQILLWYPWLLDERKGAPPGFGGVTVVDIGDVRVARGLSRRHYSSCPHRAMVYDQNERRIWCKDCEKDVEPFDAFQNLVEQYSKAHSSLVRRSKEVVEAEKFQIRSIAAKKMDEAWRSRNTVPACPHCGQGLFPEDFKLGPSSLGREFAEAMAKQRKKPRPQS